MAEEKASTDAASITGEAPEKAPVRPRNLYGYVRQAGEVPAKSVLKEGTWARKLAARGGGRRRPRPMGGRHRKPRGLKKMTMAKRIRRMAEGGTAKRYPNLEV